MILAGVSVSGYADTVYVASSGSDTPPYDTWAKATPSLLTGLSAAENDDVVMVTNGTYTAPLQAFLVNTNIALESVNGPRQTIIQGGGGRCLYIRGGYVDGFTIRNGTAPGEHGGGVSIRDYGYLENCIVTGCSAANGGGIYATNGMIRGCIIKLNQAVTSGGGIYAYYTHIIDSQIAENDGGQGYGGGVYMDDSYLYSSAVRNNTNANSAMAGGGVAVFGHSEIINCRIKDNLTRGWFGGGGIYAGMHVQIERCLISGNRSLFGGFIVGDGSGGGLQIQTTVVVRSCRIIGNQVATNNTGGGVFCYRGGTLESCVIAENFADGGEGGGVYLYEGGKVRNCTVSANMAANGAGVIFDGLGAVENSIVYANELNRNYAGDPVDFSHSCVTPDAGGDNIAANPNFRDFMHGNYRLTNGYSPCLDNAWPADWMKGQADAYGNPRIINSMPDIGAFESGSAPMDYDADDISDLAVFWPQEGRWFVNYSAGGCLDQLFGWAEAIPVTGDYDAGGSCDPALYHPASGDWYLDTFLDGLIVTNWGWAAAPPVPGDYDGDGLGDIAVYDPAGGQWFIHISTGGMRRINLGWDDAVPVPADYDGDAITDEALYTTDSGLWVILCSGSSPKSENWGWEGAIPVPADYDGDGQADIAVYDPLTGNWYIREWNGALTEINWGWEHAIPVPADYDGDGTDDIAVYDPATGDWYIHFSSGGMNIVNWGWNEALPPLTQYQINRWFGLVE
jgi:hypothetical protein